MKKLKTVFLFAILLLSSSSGWAQKNVVFVPISTSYEKPVKGSEPFPKAPISSLYATLDDHVLTFSTSHADYIITLTDEEYNEVYETIITSDTNTIILPATLSGTFHIQLDFGGSYVFISEIEL